MLVSMAGSPARRAYHKLHGAPAQGVPTWARRAAYLIPLTVLPSGLWRIASVTLHLPLTKNLQTAGQEDGSGLLPTEVYVILLSLLAEGLAFLAVGLISTWGETWPRWVPFLRAKPVRPLSAIIPAALGALILTALWGTTLILTFTGQKLDGTRIDGGHGLHGTFTHDLGDLGYLDWRAWLFTAAYLPLVTWGPLLAAVTYNHWRRTSCGKN